MHIFCLEFLLSLIENNPIFVRNNQIISDAILIICIDDFLLCNINISYFNCNELKYPIIYDENTLYSCAEYALDRSITHLNTDYFLPLLLNKINNNNSNNFLKSNNWQNRYFINYYNTNN